MTRRSVFVPLVLAVAAGSFGLAAANPPCPAPAAGAAVHAPADDPLAAHARAGYPQQISRFAHPSDTGRYIGYLVGGGALSWRKGEPPARDEGTWGWDYLGGHIRRRVDLLWWHGRRHQGGVGKFESTGPTVLHPVDEGH